MGKYNGAIITSAGQNLIAQAIAQGQTVTFTTMQASSNAYPSTTDFEALTSLTDVEATVDISYAGVYNNNVVQISARFDNTGVETVYLINTLGVFAQLGTNTPILLAVITAVTPDQMPVYDANNPSAFIYNVQITVQNADSISVSVNPAGTVTVEQLNQTMSTLETQINSKVNLSSIIDNLNETSAISGDVLSAHQGNVLAELFAPVQINLTANQNYAISDQFIYNGLLYEVTAAITQGGTITIDGNCRLAKCVTDQLIKYIDVPFSGTTGSLIIGSTGMYGYIIYASSYLPAGHTAIGSLVKIARDSVFGDIVVSAAYNATTVAILTATPSKNVNGIITLLYI